ncbi:MAG TPA: hypothetical protein VNS09_14545 [Solirubrobacter sp.]|nr:hypothetical protein [Solirubrobacter sp.]
MLRSLLLAASLSTLLIAAPAQAASYDDDAYWAFADRMQQRVDDRWDEQAGYFKFSGGGVEPMANSMQLLTYSVAALQGHVGPARNDRRARILADRLVSSPPFVTRATGTGQTHAPGWVNSMGSTRGGQHLVFDAEVIDGLVYAYRARDALALPASTVGRIRDAIHRTARGSFWRYPTIRLNQVNWYALVYAADATVTGDPTLLKHDMSLQLKRFFAGMRGTGGAAGNFGPGMRFHYLPAKSIYGSANVDSAEYANIVLTFTRFYDQARRAGMPPLSASARSAMRQWVKRAVAGYWTHAGYMNWDSGLGFQRWHQGKKFGLTQEALIGLASVSDSLLPSRSWAAWSKSMLDSGFDFYDRLAARARGGLVDPVLFDVNVVPQGTGSAYLAAVRIEANAARAVDAGLGRRAAATPPPLYSYDPDIGRLAVTTPTYNTAVIAVNQGAFPYGGLDLARLYDGRQEVAANIGGRPPASFGLLIRDIAGRRVTASQLGRARVTPGASALRLMKSPVGAAVSSSSVGRAYAGPFSDLRVTGTSAARGLALRVTHRFTRDWIQTNWTATRRSGSGRYTADVLFPSWRGSGGSAGARVVAVLRDGSSVAVGSRRVALSSVRYVWVQSERSGYVVVPVTRPRGASVHVLRAAAQTSDPRPGPTLAVQIARSSRFARATFAARIMPVHNEQEAAAAAARLG